MSCRRWQRHLVSCGDDDYEPSDGHLTDKGILRKSLKARGYVYEPKMSREKFSQTAALDILTAVFRDPMLFGAVSFTDISRGLDRTTLEKLKKYTLRSSSGDPSESFTLSESYSARCFPSCSAEDAHPNFSVSQGGMTPEKNHCRGTAVDNGVDTLQGVVYTPLVYTPLYTKPWGEY